MGPRKAVAFAIAFGGPGQWDAMQDQGVEIYLLDPLKVGAGTLRAGRAPPARPGGGAG